MAVTQAVRRFHARMKANPVTALLAKIITTVIGFVLLAAGVVMIFTPGQGILAIIAGLALLSLEYQWAHRLLTKAKQRFAIMRAELAASDPVTARRRKLAIAFICGAAALAALGIGFAVLAR